MVFLKRRPVRSQHAASIILVAALVLFTVGIGVVNGHLVFAARTSAAVAAVEKPFAPRSTKYKIVRPKKTNGVQKFFNVITRPFRKSTPRERFTAIEKELTEAWGKGMYLSPKHSDRVFADLRKLKQQGYPKNELNRLAQMAYALSSHLKDQQRLEQQKKHEGDKVAALLQELTEAKKNNTYLSPEHGARVLTDIAALESAGYAKADIDRLRALAMELSPHLADQERQVAGETGQERGQPGGGNGSSGCLSNPSPLFTADVTDLSRISQITPPGVLMRGITLKSHSYLWITDGGKVPVYAPVDAAFVSGAYVDHPDGNLDYGLIFQVSCEVEFRLGHITDPIDAIRAALPATPKTGGDSRDDSVTPILFKAGDLLAYTAGTNQAHNWDFGVYNTARFDPDAQAFGTTGKDLRANCPYDYFTPEKQGAYRQMFNEEIGSGVLTVRYCK